MNDPEEREREGDEIGKSLLLRTGFLNSWRGRALTKWPENLPEKEVEKNSARDMPKDVRQMITVGVGVPEKVIEHVGDVLDRAIMGREGLEQEVMSKRLQD